MCGIAGFFSIKQQLNETDLKKMTNAIAHRGYDAEGFFFDGLCGLGHQRLSILDLSTKANQPMTSQNERYVITYNGEVYNYQEIAPSLNIALRTTSDTEVILEAFAQRNIHSVHQLNGMFAYAIYDKFKQELYLFRDRIGIKPLFYYWDGETFAFASELKSIITLPNVSQKINFEAIHHFLHLGYIPAPKTIYQNIYKLPAGSWIKISKKEFILEKYWHIQEKIYDLATQEKLNNLIKEPEAKQQLEKLLHSAVRMQLISDVPLGIFLSGGIDSSIITAIASQNSSQKINTFSIGFKEHKYNEADHARAVAKYIGTNHEEFVVSVKEALELIPQLLNIYDEPFADSSAIPTYMVSKLARKHVKVILSGDGGDELFLGYGMYQWAERLANPFLKNVRKPLAGLFSPFKVIKYQKARAILNYPNKQDIHSHIFSQEQLFFSKRELDEILIVPEGEENYQPFRYVGLKCQRPLQNMEKQALFDLEYYLPDDLLVKVDRATMQHALEARVPLLDHRLVEFAINLHPELRYHNGETKYLLKKVLYQYVPENLFKRPKQGFAIPLMQWLQKDLLFLLEDYLSKSIVQKYNIVKYEVVENLKKRFLKGEAYYYNRLWALIILHQFLQKSIP
ncbi:MAG: asparagine synthase (glutamine-hydrolyzing) [Microscillaceae bacterium]|nr:asparagine synthase (glutamine-hydrolyzing) [Microscillaceae bacterium]MDW8460832.1 asparagine synthase (glutamine-hydrolyzing) [Cytophagales bacterium]